MQFDDVLGVQVNVRIQYLDVDKTTVMHEKIIDGKVHGSDAKEGITIAVNGNAKDLMTIPPSLDAWSQQADGGFNVRWSVVRMQSKRVDGEHEWWDWKPELV